MRYRSDAVAYSDMYVISTTGSGVSALAAMIKPCPMGRELVSFCLPRLQPTGEIPVELLHTSWGLDHPILLSHLSTLPPDIG